LIDTDIKPFLKWAGGKRQLLSHIHGRMPKKFNRYYEPFIGGGAMLFDLKPKEATINDINPALINTYKQICTDSNEVMKYIDVLDIAIQKTDLDKDERKKIYYEARNRFNEKIMGQEYDAEMAALLLFINKHCFNGLYRCNSKGGFNVPYNGGKSNSYDHDNLLAVADFLKVVDIHCTDFENICNQSKEGDFVFLDSPYAPINADSFVDYTKEGFSKEDHIRLADQFKKMSTRGVYCMLTNHNTQLIHDLYVGYNTQIVQVKRLINRDSDHRVGEEVIITNY